ncbi:translocator protein [Anabrus simplex]|uniref:translocator protein n=1 Tax=Anabrus simplex TaxID=316456 RepID=UPI0034DD4837
MPVVWSAVGAVVFPNVGGWLGGLITVRNIKPWYESLVLPKWRPPNSAFGPVWTVLYSSMGYASYLVWRDGGGFDGPARLPLILYGTQLILNWAWTPIFFGAHNLALSLADIGLLWINVAACGYSFYHINHTAGLIMLPYLAWLTLASALNYCVYRDNSTKIKEVKKDE